MMPLVVCNQSNKARKNSLTHVNATNATNANNANNNAIDKGNANAYLEPHPRPNIMMPSTNQKS